MTPYCRQLVFNDDHIFAFPFQQKWTDSERESGKKPNRDVNNRLRGESSKFLNGLFSYLRTTTMVLKEKKKSILLRALGALRMIKCSTNEDICIAHGSIFFFLERTKTRRH